MCRNHHRRHNNRTTALRFLRPLHCISVRLSFSEFEKFNLRRQSNFSTLSPDMASHGELSPPPRSLALWHTHSSPPAWGITAHCDYSSLSSQNQELRRRRTLWEKRGHLLFPAPNKRAMHGLQRWPRISGDVVFCSHKDAFREYYLFI